jgi:hypothetical protein
MWFFKKVFHQNKNSKTREAIQIDSKNKENSKIIQKETFPISFLNLPEELIESILQFVEFDSTNYLNFKLINKKTHKLGESPLLLRLLCQYKSLLIFNDRNHLNERIQKENLKELYQSLIFLDIEITHYTGWHFQFNKRKFEELKIQIRAKIEKYLEDGRLMVRLDKPYLFSCGQGITEETDRWVLDPKTLEVDFIYIEFGVEEISKYTIHTPHYKILEK